MQITKALDKTFVMGKSMGGKLFKEAAEARGLPVLQADATLDETLRDAGIHHCRSLVAALPSASNVSLLADSPCSLSCLNISLEEKTKTNT